jgi:starch phosphorylase
MEFLIGRSLTNNVTNLMLHPFVERSARAGSLDWFGLVEQEPDAGLGNACAISPPDMGKVT